MHDFGVVLNVGSYGTLAEYPSTKYEQLEFSLSGSLQNILKTFLEKFCEFNKLFA
jgi:hypothetical protein